MLCAKANKMFMRAVQQNVFLILNRVPIIFVTFPELIRASIPVLTHSLDQKLVARKAKARKCTAEILVGNTQAREACDFFFCHPTSQEQSPDVHLNVCN